MPWRPTTRLCPEIKSQPYQPLGLILCKEQATRLDGAGKDARQNYETLDLKMLRLLLDYLAMGHNLTLARQCH